MVQIGCGHVWLKMGMPPMRHHGDTMATNSTKLLAVLCTACGDEECIWVQRNHAPEVHELRVQCTRCGTSWQRHVQLGS